jgi:hypothetical protein
LQEYSALFEKFTEEQFKALPFDHPNRPLLYFTTDGDYFDYEIMFEVPQFGRFVHIKLLDSYKLARITPRANIHSVAFVGYNGKHTSNDFPNALSQFGISLYPCEGRGRSSKGEKSSLIESLVLLI